MKTLICLLIIVFSAKAANDFSFIGPRAGVGYLNSDEGRSLNKGIHSAFGWSVEIPYKSGKFVGYGEGGFLVLGVEQGIFYPTAWGFFGMRYGHFGAGAGPVVNPMGVGIGFGPYYQLNLPDVRIPIGFNVEFIKSNARFQFLVGFSLN
jgi:hypothetical protein